MFKDFHRRNTIPIVVTLIAIILLTLLPNKFPTKVYEDTERVSAKVLSTDESFIINTGLIKTGAPCRGERTAKYNRLLRIEEELKAL